MTEAKTRYATRTRRSTTLKDGSLSERAFSQMVVDNAKLRGWLAYRTWNSIHSPSGWPDLALTRNGELILAELKAEKGKLTADQEMWLAALRKVPGVRVFVWRPTDWKQIQEVLGP